MLVVWDVQTTMDSHNRMSQYDASKKIDMFALTDKNHKFDKLLKFLIQSC